MSKRKSRRRKPRKGTPPKKDPPPAEAQGRAGSRIFAALLTFATLVGGVAAIWFFVPRMTVDFSGPTDPAVPTSLEVTVRNTGVIPLNNIDAWIGICFLSERPPTGANYECINPEVWPKIGMWAKHGLSPDDAWSFSVADVIKFGADPTFRAVLSVDLVYNPWFLPIKRDRIVIFYMWSGADKAIHWRYAAPDETEFPD